ncbi:MAG: hypothetical protein IKK20_03235 [Clostridia bacterium]|nr:hypothetical protein [Clostridia bacterium]MBR2052876.1 hypothetical protein [Clostridia bacterium]MBR2221310.1 hypothetical protein [Clostridia bacterium]MBR2433799.1 hypothetical protein [Clostridia bacterium]MBR3790799.1 hypothetical protein [Clostridia bacterium]
MELALNLAELQVLSENFIKKTCTNLADNELKVLVILKIYKECSPTILISKIGILKTNLAILLKRLVSSGLVEARRSSLDARSKMFALTPAGHNLMDDVVGTIDRCLDDVPKEEFYFALQTVLMVLNKKI